jgi:hypothetical protein
MDSMTPQSSQDEAGARHDRPEATAALSAALPESAMGSQTIMVAIPTMLNTITAIAAINMTG